MTERHPGAAADPGTGAAAAEFDRPLILTTPHETGQRVRDCQWLLQGHNRFDGLATYKDGEVDGDYGPVTASAVKSAKFWLGYPLSACDEVFGQRVYEYLRPNKWKPLPKPYQVRRAERLKAAAETPGTKALHLAVGELGYKETPVNFTKYGRDYGFDGVAWCAIFLTYCFKYTGRPAFKYAAVERIYADAAAGRNGLRIVHTPARGDVATYSLHGDRFAHCAFFDHWINEAAGTFADLGGNTGPRSVNNGGEVARGDRSRSQLLAFVRVGR